MYVTAALSVNQLPKVMIFQGLPSREVKMAIELNISCVLLHSN